MPEEQAAAQPVAKVLRITEYAYGCLRDVTIHHYRYLALRCGTLVAWPIPERCATGIIYRMELERAAREQDIWWRGAEGPEAVAPHASSHSSNLPGLPHYYQVGEPKARYKIEKTFEGYED